MPYPHGVTDTLSIDCEMVGTGPRGSYAMLARVSIVNEYCYCILDEYVLPTEPVTDYRTPFSGIQPYHLVPEVASPFTEVQRVVAVLLRGRVLVGHDVENDLVVLKLHHPKSDIRDTALCRGLRTVSHEKPSLKYLAERHLGMIIQNGPHSSKEDAIAAMRIYKKFSTQWEDSILERAAEQYIRRQLYQPEHYQYRPQLPVEESNGVKWLFLILFIIIVIIMLGGKPKTQ